MALEQLLGSETVQGLLEAMSESPGGTGSTVDIVVGPEGRTVRDAGVATESTWRQDVGIQQGAPAVGRATRSTQTIGTMVDTIAQLDVADFADVMTEDLDVASSAAVSVYARRLGGTGADAWRVLQFAAEVAVLVTRRVVERAFGLMNRIRAAEPDSAAQRGLMAELSTLTNQSVNRR